MTPDEKVIGNISSALGIGKGDRKSMRITGEIYRGESRLKMTNTSLKVNLSKFNRSSELQITKATTTDKRNIKRCSSASPPGLVNLGLAKEQ